MLREFCLTSLLFLVPSAIAQTARPPAYPETDVQMQLPPPVTTIGLPSIAGSAELSNYFRGDIGFSGGYVTNLYPGSGITTRDDATFSLRPGISMNRTTDRMHATIQYAPTFDFYTPDSQLNTINHTGGVTFHYRVAPYVTLLTGDSATRTSNTWSQPLSSGTVSGSLPPTSPGFVAPYAPQISNSAYAQLAWQFASDSMIGFGGTTTYLDFYKPSQAEGLFNSNSRSASAFYTQRLGSRQYIGGLYQYSFISGTPVVSTGPPTTNLDAHQLLGFYTFYPQHTLSISLGAGTQRYNLDQSSVTSVNAWAPIAVASIGWQVPRASFALNYNHLATEGEGIIGIYTSNSGRLSTQLLLSPNWTANITGAYSNLKAAAVSVVNSTPGGHTLSFTGLLDRKLGASLAVSVQYQYLHQNYIGIPAIATSPDSSRETVSLTYHFSRPLGR